MVAKRLAALVAAVALVVAAFAFRSSRRDSAADGSTTTVGTGTGPTSATTRPGQPLRVVCATEVADLCGNLGEGYQVAAADAGATLANLAKDGPDTVDVWVTLDPWPQLANLTTPVFADAPTVIGASPLGVAVRAGRDVPLKALCGEPFRTQCLGDKSGVAWTTIGGQATWQVLKPVFDKPTSSAIGLVAYAATVVNRPTDGSLALIDLQNNDGFMTWARGVGRYSQSLDPTQGTAFEQATRFSRYDVVVTAQQQVSGSSFAFVPFTTGQAHVVAAVRTGVTLPDALAKKLTSVARDVGWNADIAPTALPSPAEVAGLQQIWNQATA